MHGGSSRWRVSRIWVVFPMRIVMKDLVHRIEESEKEMDTIIFVCEKPVHPAALSSDALGRLQKPVAGMGVSVANGPTPLHGESSW